MFFNVLLMVFGFVLLVKGADFLVKGASGIGRKFGLSEMIIGLTIVSIGTSLPEVFITITSANQGHSDLILGNAIGSCICNFLLVIGIASIVRPLKVDKRIIHVHIPIGILAMVLLIILGSIPLSGEPSTIGFVEGIILLVCTVLYIAYTMYEEKNANHRQGHQEDIDEYIETKKNKEEKKLSLYMILFYIITGVLGLKFGGDFVVDNAVIIAESFNISQTVISMTIIACGTALPEIVTSIIASRKAESDLILGNVSGSNILNLCLLIGLGAIIHPLEFNESFLINVVLLIAITVTIMLISTMDKDNIINRKKGFILVLIYIIYTIRLF